MILMVKKKVSGERNRMITFTCPLFFEVTSTTYAGTTQNYSYDNDGLLLTSGAYTVTRDAQNAYTTNLTDGTVNQNRTYNSYGELITKVEDNSFTYEITQRDNAGAITQKVETLNGTSNTYNYTFDNMGRLTQVKKDDVVVESYTYDNNGNRVSATVNGTTTTASYTLDDQLEVYGDNTYHYDDDGYLDEKTTPDGTTTYSYGTLGELRGVVTPTKTIEYLYNANNQRVAKKEDGQIVEKYLWADLTTLLAIYDKDDNLIQRFKYADNRMPISMTSNGQKYYLHYDQVGTLKAVTDTTHNIIKEISYDTYGNILSDSNPSFKVPFGFAGGLYDSDTKLTRFGYRDYDAYTGKWTAKDPIDFGGGDSNFYGYVLGDPVDFVDSQGLFLANAIGAIIGFGYELNNQLNNGTLGWNWHSIGRLAVATGTGALGGFGSTILRAVVFGAVAGATNNAYQQLESNSCKDFDYDALARSVAYGGAGGLVGYGGGKIGNILYRPTSGGVIGSPLRNPPRTNYGEHGSAIGAVVGGIIGNQ